MTGTASRTRPAALLFDVFGTVVDWRGSVEKALALIGRAQGVRADWGAFADAWRAGYRPEIYTMGHRNMLGLAMQPDTGAIWQTENGPNGGDEINLLQPGTSCAASLAALVSTSTKPRSSH